MTNIQHENKQKLRGGYYTPPDLAEFLVRWVKEINPKNILEPSCGDGQFIESLVNALGDNANITGVELFQDEAAKSLRRGNKNTQLIVSDAFDWFLKNKPDNKFNAVVGNPPFIRYQNFPEEHRLKAFQLMREEGFSPSRLTNSWLPFVVLATRALKPGGRLALILPAELLQVTYALQLRKYLVTKFKRIKIVTFKQLIFANIQQEVVVLLGDREDCVSANISILELEDLSNLQDVLNINHHKIVSLNHDSEKWTQFYLTPEELDLIRFIESSRTFIRLGDIADVDVGVVTGNNSFFILDQNKAGTLDILKFCSPIIGRSNHLTGILFKQSDYKTLTEIGEKTLLFNPGKIERQNLTRNLYAYIENGEKLGIVTGYKCSIRLPQWWDVPSVWKPDAFLLRQIHEGPKVIANQTQATSTDTIHRVRMKLDIPSYLLAAASINSLTFALSEIRGRSYGGGVLELEPTEAESLLVPRINAKTIFPLEQIDKLVRTKKTIEALKLVDSIVLKQAGLDDKKIQILRNIWWKLKTRRNTRNHKIKKIALTHPDLSHPLPQYEGVSPYT